ncbi:MAG: Malonyl CoA-acyl carrier protein transacylase [Acidimicrobiales bacterium AG-410-I20]|nr:MAG: Malonyl CoA-acyl carrier protein transacylase [Acidimicrobiales bacterium AG-410-I20]
MIAFTYSGQGSQQPGMGSAWVDHPSWELVNEASEIAGFDLSHLLLKADAEELKQTHNAQISTYLLSMVILDAIERVGVDAAGHAGHSLGEYSALTASGAIDFEDGILLVLERGLAMHDATQAQVGTMSAILGIPDETVENVCSSIDDDVWVANYNAPGQVVIAGSPSGVEKAGAASKETGAKKVTPLEVSGAFHTPFMNSARDRLSIAIDATEIRQPQGIVVANVDGTSHENPETWRALLNAQLSSPVRWHQSLGSLEDKGFSTFIELGPGTVLTGLVKRCIKSASRFSINTPEHLDSLLESLAGPLTGETTEEQPDGEHLYATERLVVSPSSGVFTPNNDLKIGNPVNAGDLLGTVGVEEIRSSFTGILQGWLAVDTERVSTSQPIAWLVIPH